MRTWAGRSFEPEAFDIAKTNEAIAAALRHCGGDYRTRVKTIHQAKTPDWVN